jgi:phage-related protein
MDKAGLDSQGMIGAMQKGLASMTEPGQSATATFKNTVDAIQGFIDKGDDASARDLAGQLFGTKGAAKFVGALKTGSINLADLAAGAGLTGDSINAAAGETADFSEKWQLVKNRASVALEPLGSQVFNTLGEALEKVMPYLEGIAKWLGENPAAVQMMAIGLGVLAVAFGIAAVATWAMNSAMLANPITWIILAVVALIAAVLLLVTHWDAVVAWLKDVWGAIVDWFKGTLDAIAEWWSGVWQGIVDFFTNLWQGLVDWYMGVWAAIIAWVRGVITAYVGFWRSVWQGIVDFFRGLWEGTIAWVRNLFETAIAGWRAIFGAVAAWFAGLWDNLKKGWTTVWDGITGFFKGIPDTIKGFFSGIGTWLYDKGKDLVQGLMDGVKTMAGKVGSFFLDLLPGWIVGPFKAALGIHSPSKVFSEYGANTIEGYLHGIQAGKVDLDREMANLIDQQQLKVASNFTGSWATPAAPGGASSSGEEFHYHAAENRSLSAEEELYAALASPRAKGGNG